MFALCTTMEECRALMGKGWHLMAQPASGSVYHKVEPEGMRVAIVAWPEKGGEPFALFVADEVLK